MNENFIKAVYNQIDFLLTTEYETKEQRIIKYTYFEDYVSNMSKFCKDMNLDYFNGIVLERNNLENYYNIDLIGDDNKTYEVKYTKDAIENDVVLKLGHSDSKNTLLTYNPDYVIVGNFKYIYIIDFQALKGQLESGIKSIGIDISSSVIINRIDVERLYNYGKDEKKI